MNGKLILALVFTTSITIPLALAQVAAPKAADPASAAASPQAPARASAGANRVNVATQDPRGCLEFSTNLEIIKCAEKYLHRKRTG
jgi:hypothetical protein